MPALWLLGGLGLGAGLMYLLDPETGAERRDVVRGHVVDYGRQTGDLLEIPGGHWVGRRKRSFPEFSCRSDASQGWGNGC